MIQWEDGQIVLVISGNDQLAAEADQFTAEVKRLLLAPRLDHAFHSLSPGSAANCDHPRPGVGR